MATAIPDSIREFNWFLELHGYKDEGCDAAKFALDGMVAPQDVRCTKCPFHDCIGAEDNYRRKKWLTALAFGFQAGVAYSTRGADVIK